MLDDASELAQFQLIQRHLKDPFDMVPDRRPGTVVILPSMTMEAAGLAKVPGVIHYEERLLCLLQLLGDLRMQIIYLTSMPLAPTLVDYAMELAPSVPKPARHRLHLFDCGSHEPLPLSEKILLQPSLLHSIRQAIPDPLDACIIAFNSSALERRLAVRLGTPLYATDPALSWLGSKSGSRQIFQKSGVPVADGYDNLDDEQAVVDALTELRTRDRYLNTAIIKLNDSFGAGGNALFSFADAPQSGLASWIKRELPRRATFASPPETWEGYLGKLDAMGAVVECFIDAGETKSPSVQLVISPTGVPTVLSSHDQMFTGPVSQIYVGGTFPAGQAYRREIMNMALRVGKSLAARSVIGLLSIDFMSARTATGWLHYGMEINLRMGGGIFPAFLLRSLVGGELEPSSGEYYGPDGRPRCYIGTDRLQRDRYAKLRPDDVIDATRRAGQHYSTATGTGTVFYMLGALDIGRLGVVAIDTALESATRRYHEVVTTLDQRSSPA